jgi:hypothetical protein
MIAVVSIFFVAMIMAQPASQRIMAQPASQRIMAQPASQRIMAQPASQRIMAQPGSPSQVVSSDMWFRLDQAIGTITVTQAYYARGTNTFTVEFDYQFWFCQYPEIDAAHINYLAMHINASGPNLFDVIFCNVIMDVAAGNMVNYGAYNPYNVSWSLTESSYTTTYDGYPYIVYYGTLIFGPTVNPAPGATIGAYMEWMGSSITGFHWELDEDNTLGVEGDVTTAVLDAPQVSFSVPVASPIAILTSPPNGYTYTTSTSSFTTAAIVLAGDNLPWSISNVYIVLDNNGVMIPAEKTLQSTHNSTYNSAYWTSPDFTLSAGTNPICHNVYAIVVSTSGLTTTTPDVAFYGKEQQSGGGGGCPNLLVWNGTAFADQGLLNIHNLINPTSDVVSEHTLNATPALIWPNFYLLELYEHPAGYNASHSWINQVMLYAVDTNGICHQCNLVFAYELSTNRSQNGNVLPLLLYDDTKWAQTYYGDRIFLLFTAPHVADIDHFVFVIIGHNMKVQDTT